MKKKTLTLKKVLVSVIVVLFALALLTAATAMLYYALHRHNALDYIPGDSAFIMASPDFASFSRNAEMLARAGSELQQPAEFAATFSHVAASRPDLFTQLGNLLSSPMHYIQHTGENRILIIDMGIRSLLFSGSLFAVRSVYSADDDVQFSFREMHYAGEDFNLYSLSIFQESIHIYFILRQNLLIISDNQRALLPAVLSKATGSAISSNQGFKKLHRHLSGSHSAVIFPNTHTLPFYELSTETSGIIGGIGYALPGKDEAEHYTVYMQLASQNLPAHFQRLLQSNAFLPELAAGIPASAEFSILLTYDDIQEMLGSWELLRSGLLETIEGAFPDSMQDHLYNWAGNTLSIHTVNGKNFMSIRTYSQSRATKALQGYGVKESNSRYTLNDNSPLELTGRAFLPGFRARTAHIERGLVVCGQETAETPTTAQDSALHTHTGLYSRKGHVFLYWKNKDAIPPYLRPIIDKLCMIIPGMHGVRGRFMNDVLRLDFYP